MAEVQIRTYRSTRQFNVDAQQMAAQGWIVANTMERRPRIGCLRIILTGFLALLFPPAPEIVVTYTRPRST